MKQQIGNAMLLTGDCIEVLRSLPECFRVNCCVTSPPYYGLRDYGHDGQIGLEQTPDEYVARLVEVFREVRRVLADDGTLWLNLGDSYNGSGKGAWDKTDVQKEVYVPPKGTAATKVDGLKPKDLLGIPWRVAFALQADGWYLRQDIIWHKPNPMPESVKDRCTKAHEYIFLLTKSARYWYDADAIREDGPVYRRKASGYVGFDATHTGGNQKGGFADKDTVTEGRNKRSVWTVTTAPFDGAHFATFPPALIEPCILAGCPAGGTVLDPFSGSGTTGQVALQQGRKYLGIELNPEYQALAVERITPHAAQERLFA